MGVVVKHRSWQVLCVSAGRRPRQRTLTTVRTSSRWCDSTENRSFDTSTTSS